jgi:hypothetical protein
MAWASVQRVWGNEKFLQNFSRKTQREIPLGSSRIVLEDNIKSDLMGICYEAVQWINVAQDRVQYQTLLTQ